jgi:DHA2 family multidrug resistance protein
VTNRIPREALLLIATAGLASLLEIVDTSIVNVAVPTMMGNLGVTLDEISWVVTGYIIANAIILPLAGWLAVRIGRRRYYVGCIMLFTAASVACGFAPSLLVLVLCRVVQGLAGGALLPTSQALIQEALPPEQAGMASALYGMVVIMGPTIGPPLGGFLTDHYGWRSIFNINVPLGILATVMALAFVRNHELTEKELLDDPRKHPIDFTGLAFLVGCIGFLQFVLERGQADDWFDSNAIRVCSFLAVFSLIGFIWWELRTAYPIVALRLFKIPNLRYGAIMMGALGFILYGLIFFVPIFCSVSLGLTATQTGELFIPGALMSGLLMPVVGSQLRKHDARIFVTIGLLFVCTCLVMMAYSSPQTGADDFFWPLLVRGCAMALMFVPLNTAVLGSFQGTQLGQVAGITNLFRQLGGSLGIAILSTLFTRSTRDAYGQLVGKVSNLNPALHYGSYRVQSMAMEMGMGTPAHIAAQFDYYRLQRQAFVIGFDHMMWVMAIFFMLALVPLYFLKPLPFQKGASMDMH